MTTAALRGVCWDHPRCVSPMTAAAAVWTSAHPDVSVTWDVRPLDAFNDEPIAQTAARYDLVIFDHPMVGAAAAAGCLMPLDDLLGPEVLAALAADSVGGSHESYHYAGRQWSVAVDAACQVSAVRDDLLAEYGKGAPRNWRDVLTLARDVPGRVAMPLDPADVLCTLLTLAASLGHPLNPADGGIHPAAVDLLVELASVVAPWSFTANPPAVLDRLASTDDIVFVPLTFGYTNYVRPAQTAAPTLRFADIPSGPSGETGAILGGAGLGVSAATAHPEQAAAFAAWVGSAATQRYVVTPNGGQPASRASWRDPAADALAGGFFSSTLRTLDGAWTRPRVPWWPAFQEEAARQLADMLQARKHASEIQRAFDALLARHTGHQTSLLMEGT